MARAVGGGETASRIVVANGTFAITRRTMFRKLFWTPSDPSVARGYQYALAEAQRKYGVEVHHAVLMPTHEHLCVTPREENLPEFLRHLHRESARFLQEHLLARGYDAPENIWDSRPTHVMRLLGAGAQASWILYAHLNPVAAGLVERVDDYPGWTTDLGLMKNGLLRVDRPEVYYCEAKDEQAVIGTAPGALARAFDGDRDAMLHWMRRTVRGMEDAYRDERRESGIRIVGAARIAATHPFAEPRTPRERRGQTVPLFKIAGPEGLLTPQERELAKHCAGEARSFQRNNRACYVRWRDGDRATAFPAGCYGMRVFHGASVAEPGAEAVLCVGDVLEDVPPVAAEERHELLATLAADARAHAAEDIDPLDDLADSIGGRRPAPSDRASTAGDDPPGRESARAPASAVPLLPPSATGELAHAARVVTLRTRRERDPPPE